MSFEMDIKAAENKALKWLIKSYELGHNTGFLHSRRNFLPSAIAWRKAYPETSGYIIENLLKYNVNKELNTDQITIQVANWLITIQNDNGSYNSGISTNKESFFNTCQILFGLKDVYDYTNDLKYKNAYLKSLNWLETCIDSNGNCTKGLYIDQYFASYYSRAIWPILKIQGKNTSGKFYKSLEILFTQKYRSDSFNNMGFYPNKNALTHTIAYTWEGFFESAKILDRSDIIEHCLQLADRVSFQIMKEKSLYAEYSENWIATKKYKCITGQAQFASLLCKSYLYKKKDIYFDAAVLLFKELLNYQNKSKNPEHEGAFPASIPNYASYFPFQYVNWTNKFFLDACYNMMKCLQTFK